MQSYALPSEKPRAWNSQKLKFTGIELYNAYDSEDRPKTQTHDMSINDTV